MQAAFPHLNRIEVRGESFLAQEIVDRLTPFLSDERRARIGRVISGRCYGVLPVLEGVHDLGNVNAVMRSAEGLGYGAAHLVGLEGDAGAWARKRLRGENVAGAGLQTAQRQSQGADKWIDLHLWQDVAAAAANLRAQGFRIAATHLSADAVPIAQVDFTIPTAIVLGNEAEGVSKQMLAEADLNVVIPIDGFIQSYNISVAAALALYHAREDRLRRQGFHGDLNPEQQEILKAIYMMRATKNAAALLLAGD